MPASHEMRTFLSETETFFSRAEARFSETETFFSSEESSIRNIRESDIQPKPGQMGHLDTKGPYRPPATAGAEAVTLRKGSGCDS